MSPATWTFILGAIAGIVAVHVASLSDAAARLGLPAPVIGMLRQYRRVL